MHTKYAFSVRGGRTVKVVERFGKSSVGEPYKKSLYERTFTSGPFIVNQAVSTELSTVYREKKKCKSHLVRRRDREPSRIPIRSFNSLRHRSTKVREFVYARIVSYIPKIKLE